MIPAPRRPLKDGPFAEAAIPAQAATINLGTQASAWPDRIVVSVTIDQGRPTYRVTKRTGDVR